MNLRDYFTDFSTNGLQMMHKAVRDAFDKDERTPQGQQSPYDVRRNPDWRRWSDAIERVVSDRGASFSPIKWEN
jgi:hypothetical protein